jgi:hypothetical protein
MVFSTALQRYSGVTIRKILNWILKLDPVRAIKVSDPEHYDPRMWR